ncbi:hypothetical protein WA026_002475 [Henosepilachna vigintioctopunctata]|uniref:Uncharacterized protein n=1 Tax=Henosepilachna vigintioctopunctata TaxID=420089 RepID=A0AAW1TRG5_9CUCU
MPKKVAKKMRHVPYAFGSSTPRFARIGFHPGLDPSGCMMNITRGGGPGQYDIGFIKCTLKDSVGSPWTRMVELEEFSRFLGFRNAPILAEREFQKTHRGPGTYMIPDEMDRQRTFSLAKNKDFTSGKRFSSTIKYDSPPANTYFRHISNKMHMKKRSFGNVPRFEWDGFASRFKDDEPPFRKPPNLYKIPDPGSLEALKARVVSSKGPYNLFTGERDGTSIKNHFSPPKDDAPDKYHLEPSDLDKLLHHPSKKRCGKFLKDERFPKRPTARMQLSDLTMCYKDPNDPGPGHYDLSNQLSIKPVSQALYPFGSSNLYQRPPIRWTIHPGPGRYYITEPSCDKRDWPSWVFLTKPGRICFQKPEEYTELY